MAEQSGKVTLTSDGNTEDSLELQVLHWDHNEADSLIKSSGSKSRSDSSASNPGLDETDLLLIKKSNQKTLINDSTVAIEQHTEKNERIKVNQALRGEDLKKAAEITAKKSDKVDKGDGDLIYSEKDPLLEKNKSGTTEQTGNTTTKSTEQTDNTSIKSKKNSVTLKTTKANGDSEEKVPLLAKDNSDEGKNASEIEIAVSESAAEGGLAMNDDEVEVKLQRHLERASMRKKMGDGIHGDTIELEDMPPSYPSPVDRGRVQGIDVTPCSICGKRVPPYGPDNERFNPDADITHITTLFVDPVTEKYLYEPLQSGDESASPPEIIQLCNRCLKVAECNKMVDKPEGTAAGSKKHLWKKSKTVITAASAFEEGIKDTRHLSLELDRKLPPMRVTAGDMTFDRTQPIRLLAMDMEFDKTEPIMEVSTDMTFDETVPEILLQTSLDINDTPPIINLNMDMTYNKTAPQMLLETGIEFDHTEPKTAGSKEITFDETVPEVLLETSMEFDKTQPLMELTMDMAFDKTQPQILLETGVEFDKTEAKMELIKDMTFDKTEPKILLNKGAKVDKTEVRTSLVLDMTYDKTDPKFLNPCGFSVDRTMSLTSLSDSISMDKTIPKTFLQMGMDVDKTQPKSSLALGLTVDKTAPKSTGVKGIRLIKVPTETNLVQSLDLDTTAPTMSWSKSLSIDRTPVKPAEIKLSVDKTPPKLYGMLQN